MKYGNVFSLTLIGIGGIIFINALYRMEVYLMLTVECANVINRFEDWRDKVRMGETVVITCSEDEKIYMINETEYNEFIKAKQNAEYLAMLDRSIEQFKNGETITFTLEELQEMEAEDWEPTEKVLEFERRRGIKRQGVKENG